MKTDSNLQADVKDELTWEPSLDDRGIIVAVKDGVVALEGHVPSYVEKWAAEKAAKNVSGVQAVVNDLVVKPAVAREDRDIAEAAVNALKASVSVPADAIKVIVRDGWITLEGQVALWYQKNAAENAVRILWGVKGISNSIEIRPQVNAGDIRGKIHQRSNGTPTSTQAMFSSTSSTEQSHSEERCIPGMNGMMRRTPRGPPRE